MSASKILKLKCDYPLCASVFEQRAEDAATARSNAADRAAWSVQHGELDFCPHHPELKKHKAALRKTAESYGTQYFTASCSCGWERQERTPSSWPTEGGAHKNIVLHDWAHHMPYEKPELCRRRRNAAAKKKRETLYQKYDQERAAAASRAQETPSAP